MLTTDFRLSLIALGLQVPGISHRTHSWLKIERQETIRLWVCFFSFFYSIA